MTDTKLSRKPLIIKPTCECCGMMAGIDCQRACEYIFGRADVTEALPIQFNGDHQFSLSLRVIIPGENFGKEQVKTLWFNSVRCAELFLMKHGYCTKKDSAIIGNGERLFAHLGGVEAVKARKKRRPNKSYLAKLAEVSPRLVKRHSKKSYPTKTASVPC